MGPLINHPDLQLRLVREHAAHLRAEWQRANVRALAYRQPDRPALARGGPAPERTTQRLPRPCSPARSPAR
jgi:hypothetical protein